MSTGIPRTSREVIREAEALGYKYSRATGGHLFYVKERPDASIGQSAKLCIPSDIKSEKTLRNILKGMGYFKAHGLDNAGQPLRAADEEPDPARAAQKEQSRFVNSLREWKHEMKRHARGLVEHPGDAPVRGPSAPKTP